MTFSNDFGNYSAAVHSCERCSGETDVRLMHPCGHALCSRCRGGERTCGDAAERCIICDEDGEE